MCSSVSMPFLQAGDLQRSYVAAQKSEAMFPEHVDTQQLIKQLKQHFARLWCPISFEKKLKLLSDKQLTSSDLQRRKDSNL